VVINEGVWKPEDGEDCMTNMFKMAGAPSLRRWKQNQQADRLWKNFWANKEDQEKWESTVKMMIVHDVALTLKGCLRRDQQGQIQTGAHWAHAPSNPWPAKVVGSVGTRPDRNSGWSSFLLHPKTKLILLKLSCWISDLYY